MAETRDEEPEEPQPALSPQEIVEAMRLERDVVAMAMLPAMRSETEIGALAIKFALADGSETVLLLDATISEALASIVGDLCATGWEMRDEVSVPGTKPN
jgi:hypothetical protein